MVDLTRRAEGRARGGGVPRPWAVLWWVVNGGWWVVGGRWEDAVSGGYPVVGIRNGRWAVEAQSETYRNWCSHLLERIVRPRSLCTTYL